MRVKRAFNNKKEEKRMETRKYLVPEQRNDVIEPTARELRCAYYLARWAKHAWGMYLDPVTVNAISAYHPLYWPEEIWRATYDKIIELVKREGKEEYFFAKRLSPAVTGVWWEHGIAARGIQVCVGSHDQLRATFARGRDTFSYIPRARVGCVLRVWKDDDGNPEGVAFGVARGTRGRDIARVVAAALISDESDKLESMLRPEIERILSTRPAGAAEFSARIVEKRDPGRMLARGGEKE
jgi:hypothetical protein